MIRAFLIAGALVASASGDDIAKTATAADREYYKSAADAAGHDPAAGSPVLWCERHGLSAERAKHLALAVLYDPSNAPAHALQGLVSFGGKWSRPEQIGDQIQNDPAKQAIMREYLARRVKTPYRADVQSKLAAWCDEHGLKERAMAPLPAR